MTAEGTVDEFVSHALRAKAALIEAVVEGRGEVPVDGDLLQELEAVLRSLSPRLADLSDRDAGEDAVDRLLREAAAAVEAKHAGLELDPVRRRLHGLSAEAIQAMARVLAGPASTRYRAASSSKPGAYYLLDVDGGDVTCTCPGFEYRGACTHARTLKAALAAGRQAPAGFELVTS